MPLIRCKVRLCSSTCTMKEIPTQIVKKCQWYDPVDGTPIRGGCRRGADCEFVHPSHLRWNDAPPPRNSFNSFNGPKRTSSNTLELGRRTSGLTSWGVPRDSGSTNDRSRDNDAFASDGFNQPESSRGGGRSKLHLSII